MAFATRGVRPPHEIGAAASSLIRDDVDTLREASLFVVSPWMQRAVIAAAQTLTVLDVLGVQEAAG